MSFKSSLITFFVTLIISQAPNLSAWYCSFFLLDFNYKSFRLDSFLFEKNDFKYRYILPVAKLSIDSSQTSVSLGILRPLVSVLCGTNVSSLRKVDGLDKIVSGNSPISIHLDQHHDCNEVLVIDILNTDVIGAGSSGLVVFGSKDLISAVSNFTVFFSDRLRIILTFVVLFVFFVQTRNKVLGVSLLNDKEINPNLVLWIIFLGFSSGVLLSVFPFKIDSSLYLKILYAVSSACHLGPVVYFIFNKSRYRFVENACLFLIATPVVLLPNGGYVYAYLGLFFSLAALFRFVFVKSNNWALFFYAISLLINFIKIGFPPSLLTVFLPHWHFSSVFIGVYLSIQTILSLKYGTRVFGAIRFVHEGVRFEGDQNNFIRDLQSISKVLSCSRVSLLKINHDNTCTVYSLDCAVNEKDIEVIKLDTFPPVFSHAITTQKELLHISENSEFTQVLRQKVGRNPLGYKFFSVIPLTGKCGDLGAIACTGYSLSPDDNSEVTSFNSAFRIFSGYFQKKLESEANIDRVNASVEMDDAIVELSRISDINSSAELESIIGKFFNIFRYKGFLATLYPNAERLEVQAVFGLSESERELAMKLPLRAKGKNEVGPIPLAVSTGRATFVNDMYLVKGLLSEASNSFLKITGCASLAVVPFDFISINGSERVRGVLYLSGESRNAFDDYMQAAVKTYAESIRRRFEHIALSNKSVVVEGQLLESKHSLSQFIPKYLVDDYMAGKNVVEEDFGFLLMFDLKGSTALASYLGRSVFREEMENLRESLTCVLKDDCWILQEYVWDSFEFTKTSREDFFEKLDVIHFWKLIREVFNVWKSKLTTIHGADPVVSEISFRICFTYGDTTRGVVKDGQTKKWSFVGNAIAVVSKIEQASKGFVGEVFCDSSVILRTNAEWKAIHETRQGLLVYSIQDHVDYLKSA